MLWPPKGSQDQKERFSLLTLKPLIVVDESVGSLRAGGKTVH
jgi:hypothetical protein